MKICDKICSASDEGNAIFSFEFSSPQSSDGVDRFLETMRDMAAHRPSFFAFSGESSFDVTLEIARKMQTLVTVDTMLRFHTEATECTALDALKSAGVHNIFFSGGCDPSDGHINGPDLVSRIRANYGDLFCVAVTWNISAPSGDLGHLKRSIEAGADFIITQFFYDTDLFFKFVSDCKFIGIYCPIIPGIMPIGNYNKFVEMTTMIKTSVPAEVSSELELIKENEGAVREYGINFGAKMCRRLLTGGVNTLHFYVVNTETSVLPILLNLGLIEESKVSTKSLVMELPPENKIDLKSVLDMGVFFGDLALEEDLDGDDVSLDDLQQELEECKGDSVVVDILSKGAKLRDHAKGVENELRHVELLSVEEYVRENDNLVSLREQIRDCDVILSQMEDILAGFQAEIGSISSDIKVLQERSMDMGMRLGNRRVAESKLARFVEDIIVPPRMVDVILEGEITDEYMRMLEILSKKIKFVESDPLVRTSRALKDVEPELEKLRQKSVSRVFDFMAQKLYALRKPKTNIQILQQSVFLKYKYAVSFLRDHGKEVYAELRWAYIDTMNKVLSAHFRAYIHSMEKLQLDVANVSDLIGVDTRSTGSSLFSRPREPLKNRSSVFFLGDRINILEEIDRPALIPHIAEANSARYPYEVLFRSLQKLLLDTAASEYLFCGDFFGETSIFYEIFAGPFSVVDEHFSSVLQNCHDAIGLMLMISIVRHYQLFMSRRRVPCADSYLDKVNISLWPRFKLVFDLHLGSLQNANVRALWEDDVHPHYVMRRYAEFTASLIHLNIEHGDGQIDLNLDRLRMAVEELIVKLARMFPKPKPQLIFLINNYDMTISVLKEAGQEGGKIQRHFEELMKMNCSVFVEELLLEHFSSLIRFVKTTALEDPGSRADEPMTVEEVEPLVRDFASRWKSAIELMHKDVITSFSNFLCGMEILRATLTQMLLYYTRISDCVKRVVGGSALNKDLVSLSSIMYEIRKYSRSF